MQPWRWRGSCCELTTPASSGSSSASSPTRTTKESQGSSLPFLVPPNCMPSSSSLSLSPTSIMPDSRRGDLPPPPEDNGYAETDPTGRYGRFDEVLGKGAMKTVYRAFDELNGMEVAWNQAKLCDVLRSPEALERMYSEVHLLSTLDHGSIIRFFTSWIDVNNRTFNFITEMFTSGTLREYRQRYRRVDIRAVKILCGLVFLHGHDPPVIHRDLKCDNIFVNGHLGQVKIGDLGLAAVLRRSQNAHSIIGTPEFMAPELYEEEYNELVDIYSFGMCVLEMLTSEYPYSECSNPAQIYKKVTSGKLPDAFHRIQDPEAKRFIGRCLETASRRSSAKELLLDPFLLSSNNTVPVKANKIAGREGHGHLHMPAHTDMTITGKMNPEDDTILLKVQIADKDGHARNIYFPFDIVSDTPIDVGNEMVKELEITDREPAEIAEVIAQEISFLVPGWNGAPPEQQQHLPQVYNYDDNDDDGGSLSHPFYYMSSPASSHMSDAGPSGSSSSQQAGGAHHGDWLQDDDDMSSMQSGKYAAVSFQSGDKQEAAKKSTRFGEGSAEEELASRFREQCEMAAAAAAESWRGRNKGGNNKLTRNKSMGDMRSQLLNRALVDGIKRRLFKTVGAVEHVGFRTPCEDGGRRPPPPAAEEKKKKKKGKSVQL